MGIGTFKGAFEDVGQTFFVDVPYESEEEFAEYLKSYNVDYGEDYGGDLDDWRREANEAFHVALSMVLRSTVDALPGFESSKSSEWATFDGDFGLVGGNGVVQVGYRQWGDDVVVSIAPAGDVLDAVRDPGIDAHKALDRHAMRPAEFASVAIDLVDAVATRLRVQLMEDGYSLTRRTSSYTSTKIDPVENVDAVKVATLETIEEARRTLSVGWSAEKRALSGLDRHASIREMVEFASDDPDCETTLVAFFVDDSDDDGNLVLRDFDPTTGYAGYFRLPLDQAPELSDLEIEPLYTLDPGPEVEAFFARYIAEITPGYGTIPVTAQEYLDATDCTPSLNLRGEKIEWDMSPSHPPQTSQAASSPSP